jgi:hypothetical protein
MDLHPAPWTQVTQHAQVAFCLLVVVSLRAAPVVPSLNTHILLCSLQPFPCPLSPLPPADKSMSLSLYSGSNTYRDILPPDLQ